MAASGIRLRSTCSELNSPQRHILGFIGVEPSRQTFRPFFDEVVRDELVSIRDWWSTEPIMKFVITDELITRRQLVMAAANKDGGAHIDSNKPSEYARLENGMGLSLDVQFTSGVRRRVECKFANLAALRQIGHEILTSNELTALAN